MVGREPVAGGLHAAGRVPAARHGRQRDWPLQQVSTPPHTRSRRPSPDDEHKLDMHGFLTSLLIRFRLKGPSGCGARVPKPPSRISSATCSPQPAPGTPCFVQVRIPHFRAGAAAGQAAPGVLGLSLRRRGPALAAAAGDREDHLPERLVRPAPSHHLRRCGPVNVAAEVACAMEMAFMQKSGVAHWSITTAASSAERK